MFDSLKGQREEYREAVQEVEASLDTIDGVVAFALRKVMVDIQKEAASVLEGDQDQPVIVTDDDDHPNANNAENDDHPNAESAAQPNNAPDTNVDSVSTPSFLAPFSSTFPLLHFTPCLYLLDKPSQPLSKAADDA
ncbi:hypothetical protein N7501_010236 [Penicillium viridicatum]|nr:hypothetical protein N7501_010236 [Penicillium viridicatum]